MCVTPGPARSAFQRLFASPPALGSALAAPRTDHAPLTDARPTRYFLHSIWSRLSRAPHRPLRARPAAGLVALLAAYFPVPGEWCARRPCHHPGTRVSASSSFFSESRRLSVAGAAMSGLMPREFSRNQLADPDPRLEGSSGNLCFPAMILNTIAPTSDAPMIIHISNGTVLNGGVVSRTFNKWKQKERNAKPTETMKPTIEAHSQNRRRPSTRFLAGRPDCWTPGSSGLSIGLPFVAS